MGRGAVHRRLVNSQRYMFLRVGPTCSGRMATEPVLMTDTRAMGSGDAMMAPCRSMCDTTLDYTTSNGNRPGRALRVPSSTAARGPMASSGAFVGIRRGRRGAPCSALALDPLRDPANAIEARVPIVADLGQLGHGETESRLVDVVQLLPAGDRRAYQADPLENRQVLGDRLTGHRQPLAQARGGAAPVGEQQVEDAPPGRVADRRPELVVHQDAEVPALIRSACATSLGRKRSQPLTWSACQAAALASSQPRSRNPVSVKRRRVPLPDGSSSMTTRRELPGEAVSPSLWVHRKEKCR